MAGEKKHPRNPRGSDRDAADRQPPDQSLRPSEELYRDLTNTLQVGVLTHGPGTQVLLCNPKALELLGLTQEQLLGRTALDPQWNIIREDGTPFPGPSLPVFRTAATRQPVRDVVMGVYRPTTQDRVWLLVNTTPQLNPDRSLRQVICTFADITQSKRLAELHKADHERLNAIINNSPVPIATNDSQRITFLNSAFVQTFGYQREDIPTLKDWWPKAYPDPEYRQQVIALWTAEGERCRQKGEAFTPVEVTITCKDGTRKTALSSVASYSATPEIQRVIVFHDITDRKRADEMLRASEQRLQLALRGGDLGLWDFNPATRQLIVNPRWRSMLGLDPNVSVVPVGDWFTLVHPDDKTKLSCLFKEIVANPVNVDFEAEIRARHCDGRFIWMLIKGAVVERAPDGSPSRVAGTSLDISERMRLAEAQMAAQRRLTAIINSSPVPMALNDERLNVTFLNPAFVQTFGYDREDIPTVADWMRQAYPDPKYREKLVADWWAELERTKQSGNAFSPLEVTATCKDGTLRTILVSAAAFPETPQGENLVVLYDITERKRAQALQRENERFLLEAVEKFPGMLGYWDCDLRCRIANQTYHQWFGLTQAQILGIHLRDLMGEALFQYTQPYVRAVLRGEDQQYERTVSKPDGSTIFILIHYIARKDQGQVLGYFSYITDVTSIKRNQEQKAKLEAELQQAQKLEAVGRLAGGIAHDFNNMLTVILGHAEIAQGRSDLAPPVRQALQEIHKAASRSADLTQQLLAFARKQPISPKVLDLNKTLADLGKLLERLVGDKIELIWRLNANPCLVKMDPTQIDQIILNLCMNAKDAIASQGKIGRQGKITIETGNRTFEEDGGSNPADPERGDYVSLAVEDNGCGMDRETQLHIFDPFFTTKEVGKGTGLGLATVYGAVTQSGGFIDVNSILTEGTTFTIYLPRQVWQATPPPAQNALGI